MKPPYPSSPFPHVPSFNPVLPVQSVMPVGAVIAFAGQPDMSSSQPPGPSTPNSGHVSEVWAQGWLPCDGSVLNISNCWELFNVIGYTYSKQDSGDSFNLPDYRGYFLRCVDGGVGRDPDVDIRTASGSGFADGVGSTQTHALQLHEHLYDQPTQTATGGTDGQCATVVPPQALTGPPTNALAGKHNTVNTSEETRPLNIYVYYLIKFTNNPAAFWPGSAAGVYPFIRELP